MLSLKCFSHNNVGRPAGLSVFFCTLLISSFFFWSGCATQPTVIRGDKNHYSLPSDTVVLVPNSKITVEYLTTDNQRKIEAVEINELETYIKSIAIEEVSKKNIVTVPMKTDPEGGTSPCQTINEIIKISDKMVRSTERSAQELTILREACKGYPKGSMLMQHLHIKIGKKKSAKAVGIPLILWSIVPQAGLQTSYLRMIIRECSTGRVLWENDFFIRSIIRPNEPKYTELIRSMFDNLSAAEE